VTDREDAEDGARPFLRRILTEGAGKLGAVIDGEPVYGWHDHAISAAALKDGRRVWVRAAGEREEWTSEESWTGNRDASVLTGIPRPHLIGRAEWDEPPVVIGAELMTYVPDPPCSATRELREPFHAHDTWWTAPRNALGTLAGQPTSRGGHWTAQTGRLEKFYGHAISHHDPVTVTEHMDLHWSNLTHPGLWILDWEYWGQAPAGYGAACLYLHSLLVPETAERVRQVFADLLDAPAGRYAQLAVIAVMLRRISTGDYPDLEAPIRGHASRLLGGA
jgi:hypothetical protein